MVIPQQARGKKLFYWDLVLNNYTDDDCECVKVIFSEIASAYIIGKEVGARNNTPHLQMCLKLKKGNYKTFILNKFKETCVGNRISIREGRNITAMREYCRKENVWLEHNVEAISSNNKKKNFEEWINHKNKHKRLYKDENVSISELISNWEYYKRRSDLLQDEIKVCRFCLEEKASEEGDDEN